MKANAERTISTTLPSNEARPNQRPHKRRHRGRLPLRLHDQKHTKRLLKSPHSARRKMIATHGGRSQRTLSNHRYLSCNEPSAGWSKKSRILPVSRLPRGQPRRARTAGEHGYCRHSTRRLRRAKRRSCEKIGSVKREGSRKILKSGDSAYRKPSC